LRHHRIQAGLFAQEASVDLIVTDHHEWRVRRTTSDGVPGEEPDLPEAYALVHPRLPGSDYANPHLTGAGVAFKLAWEVGKQLTGKPKVSGEMREFLIEAMALAALGTIADVAPLTGENRVIARFGLGGLTRTRLRGLRALIDSAGLGGQNLDSYHVGFLLGPRLNACGRMGHAEQAVHMLTRATSGEARDIASFLENQNRDRQATEKKIVEAAVEQIRDRGWDSEDHPAIVVEGEGWHVGVVGIVASRLVDQFHRPVVVLSTENGAAGGSGRSIPRFHLAHALAACDDLLESHGGHAMAAGLRLKSENVDAFRRRLLEQARRDLAAEDLSPTLRADAEVTLDCVGEPLVAELGRLGPFGIGNPKPVLIFRDLTVLSARACGKNGDHLQLLLDDGRGCRIKAIAFRCGELAQKLRGGDTVDLAAEPCLNEWNGRVSVELTVKDLAPRNARPNWAAAFFCLSAKTRAAAPSDTMKT
jgi:single-stranded-DNA-specific exonuclease